MKIVCLCGSTRFYDEFVFNNARETLDGNIVLSCGVFGHSIHSDMKISDPEKQKLDRLHKEKIRMADEILVICPDNYIGESTRAEIELAQELGKVVRYTDNGMRNKR